MTKNKKEKIISKDLSIVIMGAAGQGVKAIKHKGLSIVDIFQTCVSFNKVNNFKWFKNNTDYLKKDYDPADRNAAFKKAQEQLPFPLGLIYLNKKRSVFEQGFELYRKSKKPLYKRRTTKTVLKKLLKAKI